MGVIRFVLAMLVVYYHARGSTHIGLPLPSGRTAVQLFYVISGFYMALILNEKYKTPDMNSTFYSNRLFRLWPPMMVIAALVVFQFFLTREVLLIGWQGSLDGYMEYIRGLDYWFIVYLIFTNFFIVGQEWVWFFRVDPVLGATYCPSQTCPGLNGASFLFNHVTFTVAIEAVFYLISPFLLRRSVRWAAALCAVGFAWHVFVYVAGLDRAMWSYFFVGSAAFFYFLGACMYHVYAWLSRLPPTSPHHALLARVELPAYLLALALGTAAFSYVPGHNYSLAVLLALIIPLLFRRTKANGVDRQIGELSFGIYLTHYPIMLLLGKAFAGPTVVVLTAILATAAAALLYAVVERPIDQWRQRRVRVSAAAAHTKGAASLTA